MRYLMHDNKTFSNEVKKAVGVDESFSFVVKLNELEYFTHILEVSNADYLYYFQKKKLSCKSELKPVISMYRGLLMYQDLHDFVVKNNLEYCKIKVQSENVIVVRRK